MPPQLPLRYTSRNETPAPRAICEMGNSDTDGVHTHRMTRKQHRRNTLMLLRLKLRIGALLIIAGGGLAAVGELLNIWNTDPTTGGWFLAMGLVVLGTLVFVYGINMYAQLSDSVNFLGLIGSGLLFLGGWLTIVGSIVVNMVVLPMLLGLAATIATAINAPGAAAQTATNTVS